MGLDEGLGLVGGGGQRLMAGDREMEGGSGSRDTRFRTEGSAYLLSEEARDHTPFRMRVMEERECRETTIRRRV